MLARHVVTWLPSLGWLVTLVLVLWWRSELPSAVAVQWNFAEGTVLRSISPNELLLHVCLLGALLLPYLGLLPVQLERRRVQYVFGVVVAYGGVTFSCASLVWIAWSQRGVAPGGFIASPTVFVVVALFALVAAAAGGLAARIVTSPRRGLEERPGREEGRLEA